MKQTPKWLRGLALASLACWSFGTASLVAQTDGCGDTFASSEAGNDEFVAPGSSWKAASQPLAPGGGAGGTIGSLPMYKNTSTGASSILGGSIVPFTTSTPIGVLAAPAGSGAIAFLWIANGIPASGSFLVSGSPFVFVNLEDVAKLKLKSLRLQFIGVDGSIVGTFAVPTAI